MLNSDLSLKYLIKESSIKGNKSPLLILLHGFGSNEDDLFSFYSYLPKKYTIISLRAPFELPMQGYAWYNINFDKEMNKFNDHKQANDSIQLILKFINEISLKYNVDNKSVSLLGFSQGTIISYALALNFPLRFKSIIGFSGYIDKEMLNIKSNELYKNLNFYISHGKEDPVIPFDWSKKSAELLDKLNINYSFKEFKSGHTISAENFFDFKNWFSTV